MADILIRDMEMPKGCRSCPFYAYDGDMDYYCLISSDNEPCPLVPLPEGHGRLIDADALREDWLENGENEYIYDTNAMLYSIDNSPTIVPAEGGTDE